MGNIAYRAVVAHPKRSVRAALILSLALIISLVSAMPTFASGALQEAQPDYSDSCFAIADETSANGNSDSVVMLIKADGSTQQVGTTGTNDIETMAFRPGGDVLYAVDGGTLGTIDYLQTSATAGQFTAIGPIGSSTNGSAGTVIFNDIDSLSFDIKTNPATLYGVQRRNGGAPDVLIKIDVDTGKYIPNSFLGGTADYVEISGFPTEEDDIDDIAINPVDGVLYGAANNGGTGGTLVIINKDTGVIELPNGNTGIVGPTFYQGTDEVVDDIEGLAFFNDGQLYGSSGNNGPDDNDKDQLFRIDETTGNATVIGAFPAGGQDYEALGCLTAPAFLAIQKYTNGPGQLPQDANLAPGAYVPAESAVTWTFIIANTAGSEISDIVLEDDQLGVINNPAANPPVYNCNEGAIPSLGSGQSFTCTVTGTAITGQYSNIGTATGTALIPNQTLTASDPSFYFGYTTGITLDVTVNDEPAPEPTGPVVAVDSTVEFDYTVTNTSNVDLINVVVTDPTFGTVCEIPFLAVGASSVCTETVTAVAGQYSSPASVTGVPADSNGDPILEDLGGDPIDPVTDDGISHYFAGTSGIEIEKSPDTQNVLAESDVTFTIKVTNTGDIALTDIEVKDPTSPACERTFATLAPNASEEYTCTVTGVVKDFVNVATVEAKDTTGKTVTDDDDAEVKIIRPSIEIEKSPDTQDVLAGDDVTFTIKVTNTGDVDLTDVVVTDPTAPDCDRTFATLAAQASEEYTCVITGVVKDFVNTAMVTAKDPLGNTVDDKDDATVNVITRNTLGDLVFEDLNANGVQDTDEPGIAGIVVKLLDADGTELESTTTDADGNYQFTQLAPGTYIVEFMVPDAYTITAQDAGDDDTKDSDADPTTGRTATITLTEGDDNQTVDAGVYKPASLGDIVFLDSNGNGIQDADEAGVAGVTVKLLDDQGTELDSQTTDENGAYDFTDLKPGSYIVEFVTTADQTLTTKDTGDDDTKDSDADPTTGRTDVIELTSNEDNNDVDAGILGAAALGDTVFLDSNGNGIQDADEAGVAGVTVKLLDDQDTELASTTTDENGNYDFTNLAPGNYKVMFVAGDTQMFTSQDSGDDDTKDSDADPTTGMTTVIALSAGEDNDDVDAGIFEKAMLGDRVFDDEDADGIQDAGETGVAGVTVNLLDENGDSLDSTTTDENGDYKFTDLAPGTYIVEFVKPDGYTISDVDQGDDDTKDSDAKVDTGRTDPIELKSGDNNDTVDAGIFKGTSLGDRVFEDDNLNGIQDADEDGVAGVVVKLLDEDGNELDSTTTDENGNYRFVNLDPGNYIVEITLPTDYQLTSADQGDDDAADSDFAQDTRRSPVITLASSEDNDTIDAGIYKLASIGDRVFSDANDNGVQDDGEAGIAGITVILRNADGTEAATTTTDENGDYKFTGLNPGQYRVEVTLPTDGSVAFSAQDQGTDDTKDSDVDPTSAQTDLIDLDSGEDNMDVDAGLVPLSTIGDLLFNDLNGNGIQEDGEPGIGNQVVTLLDDQGNVLETAITDLSGRYEFTGVRPGTYQVRFDISDDYKFSASDQGDDDAKDSDANPDTGLSPRFVVDGTDKDDIDAGVFRPIKVKGEAFLDDNDNALQEDAEGGVAGIRVDLLDQAGNVIRTTTTDASGMYMFGDLTPGSYLVRFIPGADFELVAQDAGLDDTIDSDADPTTGRTAEFTVQSGDNVEDIDAGLKGTNVQGITPTPIAQNPPTITKDANPDITRSGKAIDFDIVVNNPNTTDLRNVTITDTLSDRFIYQSATASPNGTVTFNAATNMLMVTVASIPPQQSVTVTVKVIVKTSTLPGTVINNTASVTSSAGNAQDSDTVTVIPEEIPNTGVDQFQSLNVVRDVLLLLGLLLVTVAVLWFVSRGRSEEDDAYAAASPARASRLYFALGLVFVMIFGVLGWGILRWSDSNYRSDLETDVAGVALAPVELQEAAETATDGDVGSEEASTVIVLEPEEITRDNAEDSALLPLADDDTTGATDVIETDSTQANVTVAEAESDAEGAATNADANATDNTTSAETDDVIVDPADPRIPHLIIPRLEINEAITDIPIEGVTWNLDDLGGQIGWLHTTGAEPYDKYAMVFAAHVTLGSTDPGPFLNLDQLQDGDEIVYRWNNVDYVYQFSSSEYVDPSAVESLYIPDGKTLLLVTCSNWDEENETFAERLLATAEFIREQPVN